jgi:hypothetical protein
MPCFRAQIAFQPVCATVSTASAILFLAQVMGMPGMVTSIVESLKYLTPMAFDVMTYAVLKQLASPKKKLKVGRDVESGEQGPRLAVRNCAWQAEGTAAQQAWPHRCSRPSTATLHAQATASRLRLRSACIHEFLPVWRPLFRGESSSASVFDSIFHTAGRRRKLGGVVPVAGRLHRPALQEARVGLC